eukprot:Skav235369  [mRNA]  locus=scaffold3967:149853:151106:+ [translate_table: standard]
MGGRVKNALFFNIRDQPFQEAKKLIAKSKLPELLTHYRQTDQTTLFFAAARESGQDEQALGLCRTLLERGVAVEHTDELDQTALFYAARQGHSFTIRYLISRGAEPNHLDKNGQTALFFAASNSHVAAIKALLEGGAKTDIIDNYQHTCLDYAEEDILPIFSKKRHCEDSAPGPKRRRTVLEELRSWADAWPIREEEAGEKIYYAAEDVVLQSAADGYAVVKNAPEICAARVRLSEKHFVIDHAQLFEGEQWVGDLTPEEWCKAVGVITDEPGNAVDAIKAVVAGKNPRHFTLPLVETKSKKIAGYVHATHTPEKQEMSIAHIKVDAAHMGQGLGGLLIEAAENHSKEMGWSCKRTYLSVLKANTRAQRCYAKAGFRFESSRAARWGSKQHPGSEWQRFGKVHKHHVAKKSRKLEKQ